ncbi:putative carbohydrate ABC transporter, permease protein [metagenome]|uniref:Putative carbohydrate ABC transporter, permease protein n=1 Tax=metagenome TaxID=256318 RepID=A0A2P2C0N5_9ZZZZ
MSRRLNPTVVILAFVSAVSAFPLYFMVVMASRRNEDITSVPPPLLPGGELWTNIDRVLANPDVTFARAIVNSLVVASITTVAVVLFSSMAGFAFAKLRFLGRQPLLAFVLATMMVPIQLGLIPLYMLMTKLHLAGSLPSVMLPFLVSGFGVFMMRQFVAQAVPDELLAAARIDGASTWRTFWYVVMPVLRPAAAVLALLTFMERWNDFLWPYLVLDLDHPTVQVALSRLAGGYYTDQSLVMAGTLLGVLPLLVVFILFGRQIVGGIMEGSIKS